MTVEQARNIDLASFIEQLGHQTIPGKGKDNEAWFLSPFRSEKTASFKVDRRQNKWKDFAEEYWRGDIIDFIRVYADKQGWGNWDTKQALKELDRLTGGIHVPTFKEYTPKEEKGREAQETRYKITRVDRIRSGKLVTYLRSRKIYAHVAKPYLDEIHYLDVKTNKELYGLCWQNVKNGYEMRNPFFKTCIGTKAISIVEVVGETQHGLAVFEGMMDFLSYLLLLKDKPVATALIMNSRSLYQPTIDFCLKQGRGEVIQGFLQNDKYGLETAARLKKAVPQMVMQNEKYLEYEDVNDYLMGKKQAPEAVLHAEKWVGSYL